MRNAVKSQEGSLIVEGARVSAGGRASTRWFGIGCAATLCWAGFGNAPVLAGEFALGAGYSLAYDSNINRVPDGVIINGVPTSPIAEWTQSLIGGFAYQESTVDLDMRLLAQAERRDYLRNTYVNETAYYVNGAAVWTILPQQFTWTIEDVARQIPLAYSTVDTPSNRTNGNILSTGPEFTLRLNPADAAAIGARYGRFDVEGPGDNERYTAYARLLHQMSSLTNLSLNYQMSRVNYQDPSLYTNFLLEIWYLRYEMRPSPSGIAVEVGTNRIIQEGQQDLQGRYGRLILLHQLTRESLLSASFESGYGDAGAGLLGRGTGLTPPLTTTPSTPATAAIANPFYSKRGELTFDRSGPFRLVARGYARSLDYLQSDQSNREHGGRFECTWLYSDAARIVAYADYLKRTFVDFFEEDTLRTGSVAVMFRLNRNVFVTVEGARYEQSSTVPLNNFVDRRAMLTFGYSTGSLYTPQPRR